MWKSLHIYIKESSAIFRLFIIRLNWIILLYRINCLYSFFIIIDELLSTKVFIFLQLENSSQDITRLICSSRSIDILWKFSHFKKLELSNVSIFAHVDLLPRKATNPLVFYKILYLTNTTLVKRTLIET